MFDKELHIIAGLPRSGSTLLCNVLAQNPKFHCTATSGILDILVGVRNRFQQIAAFNAMPESELEATKINVLRGILYGYFANTARPICFDKSRGWERYLEMFQAIIGTDKKVKAIICVRDVREILASFERLYAKTSDTRQVIDEGVNMENYVRFDTTVGRCEHLMQPSGIVGSCINRIKDAVQRGWKTGDKDGSLYICEYEKLAAKPRRVMEDIYEFLGYEEFKHDFDNVQQVTFEDDVVHVYKDLHRIQPKIKAPETTWPKRIPAAYAKALDDQHIPQFWKSFEGVS